MSELCPQSKDAIVDSVFDGAGGGTKHVGKVFLGQSPRSVGGVVGEQKDTYDVHTYQNGTLL